mgnify:CR=1 FL=1
MTEVIPSYATIKKPRRFSDGAIIGILLVLHLAVVLARLGFRMEGLARDYLFIDGAWREHQITALTNPGFSEPPDW